MVTGQYDTDGYTVFQNGQMIYHAGNSPYDSHQSVGPEDALSINILAVYCQNTMAELATERNDEVGECIRVF